MNSQQVKICGILKTEYPDFCAYCESAGKVFVSDLTNIDFVAFRTRMEKTREYISSIKRAIESALSAQQEHTNETIDINSSQISDVLDVDIDQSPVFCQDNNEQLFSDNSKVYSKSLPQQSEVREVVSELQDNCHSQGNFDNEDLTLASLFEVEANDYSSCSFDKLNFSGRALHGLIRSGCKTIGDLLLRSISELKSVRNMGIKTVHEILEKTKEFVKESSGRSPQITNERSSIDNLIIDNSIRDAIESILFEEGYSTEGMSIEQIEFLDKIRESVDIIGRELCLEAFTNPQYAKQLCQVLESFAMPLTQRITIDNSIRESVYSLPFLIKERKAIPFITAFIAKTKTDLTSLLLACDENTQIHQLPDLDGLFTDKTLAFRAKNFISWINIDVQETIERTISAINNSLSDTSYNGKTILESRASGSTLEELGRQMGLSRERVRQIELRMIRRFWAAYNSQQYDLIMLVFSLRDGDRFLYYAELKEYFQGFTDLIWYVVKHTSMHDPFGYSKEIDAIIVKNIQNDREEKDLITNVNKALSEIPAVIESSQTFEVFRTISIKYGVPLEIIQNHFYNSYRITGSFYSRSTITVVFMCNFVLKQRFPAGFKIGDSFESNRFRQYMVEFFGDRASTVTNRAIDAKVGELGVLCDRGKYIHPDLLQVDKEIIDEINNYIEDSPRSLLTYGEIFEALAGLLEGTQITNRYYLQGALKKYGCRFKTGRDYVRKTQNVSFVDELDAFVEERGTVHKSEIFAEFTSLSEAGLGQVVARSTTVFNIDNGYYIHASSFDIQPKDYKQIRDYLTEACADIPVNIRSVYDAVSSQFPDFLYRNDFDDRNKLFAALNYMFRDEFNFSKPYIAKLGVNDVTNKSVILQHIADYDQIEISELIDICEENNIRYVASSYLIQQLAPEFVRIDADTLMRRELTGITDESVDKAVEIISDMLEVNDYIVGAKIDDFLWYPQIEIDWNEFLLENLIVQSGKVNVVYLIGDPLKHPNAVYVSNKYKDDTFDSMLIKILTDEVRKGSFTSKVEMRDWLKEEGFIEGKMPNFLESEKYFYVDGTGVHCADN